MLCFVPQFVTSYCLHFVGEDPGPRLLQNVLYLDDSEEWRIISWWYIPNFVATLTAPPQSPPPPSPPPPSPPSPSPPSPSPNPPSPSPPSPRWCSHFDLCQNENLTTWLMCFWIQARCNFVPFFDYVLCFLLIILWTLVACVQSYGGSSCFYSLQSAPNDILDVERFICCDKMCVPSPDHLCCN